MPTRIIRDGFLGSDKVTALNEKPTAESLYIRLLLVADDYGRYYATPTRIARACWPNREDVAGKAIEPLLQRLESVGLVELYSVGGRDYLQISNSQQRTRRESMFPAKNGLNPSAPQTAANGGGLPQTAADGGEPRRIAALDGDVDGDVDEDGDEYKRAERVGAVDVEAPKNDPDEGVIDERDMTVPALIKQYTANADLRNDLKSFVTMRKGMRRPVTVRAMRGLLKKLDELAQTDESRREVVREAEMKAWLSFYPVGGSGPGGATRAAQDTTFSLQRKNGYDSIQSDFDGLDGTG
jgi:hypothetical protein